MNSCTLSQVNSVTVSLLSPASITGHTRYIEMLLEVDYMLWVYNIIASVAYWVLLAGYLVIPGIFIFLQKSEKLEQALISNGNLLFLVIACVFFAVGTMLLIWLCWTWRSNYIWLVGRLFTWSIMALVTTVMVGSAFLISLLLTVLYKYILLKKVEEEHKMEMCTRILMLIDNYS
ncbi:uncharacterized protein BO88DRAFT_427248 [Aspergillus vadensis CBS 113365]|uniref:Uncharacterized protein n=1 Tax=Aspergillus vadensis (strain CBS 113365 / IMI 142717 / IBT 24658) TaxID=1448311 RepID=A0A319B5H3_ASPVC|nr:hypothetical protein BO88DRAFT_427248 [Aspergillus vadensis CBS 113365]PYH67054.1 hypothetical protein BO88DRAFT_427248 [Aspergillus vadensis CBS 113365]